ncbi:hypothetical protein SYNPS1DRAFT_26560 [Syncephalis pseudoplumigaleata]|uniref:Ribosomal protein mS38 C-terminal domain-containing protein n=1 Tax=Syncephalis pseudoplumigaleata TaxID=1712513 RepID=A0A4V1J298_9FUNG|nr:hypothetical protein SYNPS1DRAFT_26560 [Syncephalis pseudoplumigaleata]|eukprot:RKP27809.1 hypothetical protein SYNPS1DRAFT_26560 [Syncephalis pseudoplumigaleata]
MSLGRSLAGLTRRWMPRDQASCLVRSPVSSVSALPATYQQQQRRSYYVSDPSRAAHPPAAPSPWGDSLQASVAESKAVAQDRFYALHRPLLSYQPLSRPRSIFVADENDNETISVEYTSSGKSADNSDAMEALAEKCHYFQPFRPPRWVQSATAAPAVGQVLSPAADPHYWAQYDGASGQHEGSGTVAHRARADAFLEEGDAIVQRMPEPKPSSSSATPLYATSIKRKRKLKMNKHKRRKLRKGTRALRKRLGKI